MDIGLSERVAQALVLRDQTERALSEIRETLDPLLKQWLRQLEVGDIVNHHGERSTITRTAGGTIESQAEDRCVREYSPVHTAPYRPWMEVDEARYQLRKRRAELAVRIEQLPESQIAELEALLLKSS